MKDLYIKDICHSYGDKKVLQDINIHLNKGEFISILGASGSGKTTLFNIISGILKASSGKVFLDNNDITGKTGYISYMLQKDLLLPYMTIEDNIALPLLIKGEKKSVARQKVETELERFGLLSYKKDYPNKLSGGMRQRAALLRTYMFSKEVVLLDEPFSALDTLTKSDLHEWYIDVVYKLGISTLFITHDIEEAIYLSDRIYILKGSPGKIEDEIVIESSQKRRKEFRLSIEFLEYKKKIIDIIS